MNEDRKEVFRGHFEECLNHFGVSLASRAPKGTREAAQAKRPMADFCGVAIGSAERWVRGGSLPVGGQHFKLMCFLDMTGYRVIELERMPKVLRNIAELISFGILSYQEATELLQYSVSSQLFAVLRGDQGISEEKEQKAWDVWKERREAFEKKKEQARELYRLDVSPRIRTKTESSRPVVMSAHRKTAVVSIMEGLLALLEDGSFEKSEDSLAELHQSTEMVLNLSARLSVLSSRLITSKERKGGS